MIFTCVLLYLMMCVLCRRQALILRVSVSDVLRSFCWSCVNVYAGPQVWAPYWGYNLPSNDIKDAQAMELWQCKQTCLITAHCRSIVYVAANRMCYIKNINQWQIRQKIVENLVTDYHEYFHTTTGELFTLKALLVRLHYELNTHVITWCCHGIHTFVHPGRKTQCQQYSIYSCIMIWCSFYEHGLAIRAWRSNHIPSKVPYVIMYSQISTVQCWNLEISS